MKYFIPINEANEGESVTVDIVDVGDVSERVAKRKLRQYLIARGVKAKEVKTVMKKMGFL